MLLSVRQSSQSLTLLKELEKLFCDAPGCFFLPQLCILAPVASLDFVGFPIFTEITACDQTTFDEYRQKLKKEQTFSPIEQLKMLNFHTTSTPTTLFERWFFNIDISIDRSID